MYSCLKLYSSKVGEIYNFLNLLFKNKKDTHSKNIVYSSMYQLNSLEWECIYYNPIDMVDVIGVLMDNINKYKISIWISLDKNFFIKVTEFNANNLIKYLYERYPY